MKYLYKNANIINCKLSHLLFNNKLKTIKIHSTVYIYIDYKIWIKKCKIKNNISFNAILN